ncbi:hypothetical protein H5410_028068 [Solanum commersonii]|uniref:DNA-directed DNA polymerase n=1 Tax=Solanum commersonii TaxID=4109 RepID=A0A9J5Z3R9_SOLCO|nr:hypothetical protein H5410_028068 [Solanum commersonii]
MKHDILLLGDLMHRAQEIHYSLFQIDIVKKMTQSSLALDIFRTLYYDKKNGLSIYLIGIKIHLFAAGTTTTIAIDTYLTAKNYITMMLTHYIHMIKAKKDGNDSLAFVYKIIMNSLYGRFGINPETTLAMDITACARIHMHSYISRDDCHYTDTNSVLLNGLLQYSNISSMELGKFKLECASYEGICLAAKSYTLFKEGHNVVIKHKGVAKSLLTLEWYKKQCENLNRIAEAVLKTLFYVNWKMLDVGERSINVHLGSPTNTKRESVYDNNNAWVVTKPFHVIDYARQDIRVLEWKLHSLQKEYEPFKATITKYKDG